MRDFAPSYFDDVYVHSRAVNEKTDVEMHKEHLREQLGFMRKHKLYANLELRQFLGLATYLCKYVDNYAGKIRPLSQLLKKEAAWERTAECQQAFDAVRLGLTGSPILAVADQDLASAERNYPVHDKELLAMKYALAKFRVYLLGNTPFVVYTSLRTAVKSPHISQRMARWLSFFAEYNFRVEYKPGRLNVVADALSRRPDYAVKTADVNRIVVARTFTPSSSLLDEVKAAYAHD
ncbi:reverse transcriptase, partial [Phytophthora megakarya]